MITICVAIVLHIIQLKKNNKNEEPNNTSAPEQPQMDVNETELEKTKCQLIKYQTKDAIILLVLLDAYLFTKFLAESLKASLIGGQESDILNFVGYLSSPLYGFIIFYLLKHYV